MQIPVVKHVTKSGPETSDLFSYLFQANKDIFLTGEINDATATAIIAQLDYLDGLDTRDIRLHIQCPGGTVSAGLAIIDAMRRCRCDVSTIATGMAASMGAVILACGTPGKRFATPLTDIMVHQPLGSAQGQASDILLAAQHIFDTREQLNQLLAKVTGQTAETVASHCDRDCHMDAEKAKDFGIIDAVLTRNGI